MKRSIIIFRVTYRSGRTEELRCVNKALAQATRNHLIAGKEAGVVVSFEEGRE